MSCYFKKQTVDKAKQQASDTVHRCAPAGRNVNKSHRCEVLCTSSLSQWIKVQLNLLYVSQSRTLTNKFYWIYENSSYVILFPSKVGACVHIYHFGGTYCYSITTVVGCSRCGTPQVVLCSQQHVTILFLRIRKFLD